VAQIDVHLGGDEHGRVVADGDGDFQRLPASLRMAQ
jgi:hypothetical protein